MIVGLNKVLEKEKQGLSFDIFLRKADFKV